MTMYVNEHECEYVSMWMDGCVSACVIKCEYVCVYWLFDGKGAYTQATGALLVFEIGYPHAPGRTQALPEWAPGGNVGFSWLWWR